MILDPGKTERRALSVNEAAATAGIGRSTIYNLLRAASLKTVKTGKRRLVLVESLESLLETGGSTQ